MKWAIFIALIVAVGCSTSRQVPPLPPSAKVTAGPVQRYEPQPNPYLTYVVSWSNTPCGFKDNCTTSLLISDLPGGPWMLIATLPYATSVSVPVNGSTSPNAFFCAANAIVDDSLTIALEWDPVTDVNFGGYRVYYGTACREYCEMIDVGNVLTTPISGLKPGTNYYFAVTSYEIPGLESLFSEEVTLRTVVDPPFGLNITTVVGEK